MNNFERKAKDSLVFMLAHRTNCCSLSCASINALDDQLRQPSTGDRIWSQMRVNYEPGDNFFYFTGHWRLNFVMFCSPGKLISLSSELIRGFRVRQHRSCNASSNPQASSKLCSDSLKAGRIYCTAFVIR